MRLLYVAPGPLEPKGLEAVKEFSHAWPGEFVVLAPNDVTDASGFRVVVSKRDGYRDSVTTVAPDVVLALHRPEFEWLTSLAPTVYTSEVTRQIRTDIQLVAATSRAQRARIVAGQLRLDRVYRRMARAAAGLQCNGSGAWDAYGALNRRSMQFRDHRIWAADLELARQRPVWRGTVPLRVAFSGRITAIKGPDVVVEVAAQMPEHKFVMVGDGDMRASLEARAPENLTFIGSLRFPQWKQYMREHVDIALLPHPQGDPSGTYFEALGCGVPVIGRDNSTWKKLAQVDGIGWAESSASAIVRRIGSLSPDELTGVRERALDTIEPFECVAARRMEHLAAVARGVRS